MPSRFEQADGQSRGGRRRKNSYHRWLKRARNRAIRRRSRQDPIKPISYSHYRGYET